MKSFPKILLIVLLVVVAGFAAYYSFKDPEPAPETTHIAPAQQGDNAQASIYLSGLKDLQGNAVDMDSEKFIFLNVWATWCGPCNIEMPGIQSLYEKYKDNPKVAFYVVSDEDAEVVQPFIQRKGYKLPFYQYTGLYPVQLDGNAIPRTYLIHKGKILEQGIGASHWDTPEITGLIEKEIGG